MDNNLNNPDEIYDFEESLEENLEENNDFFVGSMEDNMKAPPIPTTVRVFEVLSPDDVHKITTIYNNKVFVEDRIKALEEKKKKPLTN